ncbi:hypothetical protein OGM63_17875 [Plectonema radiosum NIES-515]|uniref:Uncharacterized protein n=1 Tax=Plectonema radiosum NIES-515 TaxID=2986073 RepID=A0ABT3B1X8_9CYAN|nr:hypothetical protein [Plectonema radiosum]MCV3215358.1 hypothetical protein [Plectonema radiosum NIES-515]
MPTNKAIKALREAVRSSPKGSTCRHLPSLILTSPGDRQGLKSITAKSLPLSLEQLHMKDVLLIFICFPHLHFH